jgi:hypothetical protein
MAGTAQQNDFVRLSISTAGLAHARRAPLKHMIL